MELLKQLQQLIALDSLPDDVDEQVDALIQRATGKEKDMMVFALEALEQHPDYQRAR